MSFEKERKSLVQSLPVKTASVRNAFLSVPREKFFPEHLKKCAYADSAFPIGLGQTISQPSTIAIMLEMLQAKKGQRFLEIGSGSGYVLALLSKIAGEKGRVFGVELLHELEQKALRTLAETGCKNVKLKAGDGTKGWKEFAPFDRIVVSAACEKIPKQLAEQLKEGGIAVAPLGGRLSQELVKVQKTNGELEEREKKCCFVFVPLKNC
jgi:protein-L-isoaspartate(D-aspartate) O-methyltransferase